MMNLLRVEKPDTDSSVPNNNAARFVDSITIAAIIFVTFVLLAISIPPIRDWVLPTIDAERLKWLRAHRSELISWIDWLRILFEVALALFISNQVFNEQLTKFFEKSLDRLKKSLMEALEKSVNNNDARVEIRKAINELLAFMYLRPQLKTLPSELPILLSASMTIYVEARRGIPFFL